MSQPAPVTTAYHRAHFLVDQWGFSVVPIRHASKKAAVAWEAYQKRRPNPTELKRWFVRPDTPMAIVTGAISGIVVVDADSPEAMTWAQANLPDTPLKVATPRGTHLYYKHPGGTIGNRARIRTGEGQLALDVRGDGGYVLAPGSLHPDGGTYKPEGDQWRHPELKADLPEFAKAWVQSEESPAQVASTGSDAYRRAKLWLAKRDPAIEGSGGDTQTFTTACGLVRGFRLSDGEALELLREWNTGCVPPWTERELQAKIASAHKSGSEPYGYLLDVTPSNVVQLRPRPSAPQEGEPEDVVEGWRDPVPLRGTGNQPEFPVHLLPARLQSFVAELSEALQVPADLPAMMTLAAFSAISQGRFQVQASPEWTVPLNIYACTVMVSGSRKSAAVRPIMGPLEAWEKQQKSEAKTKVRDLENKLKAREGDLEQGWIMRRRRSKNAPSENALFELAAEVDKLKEILETAQPQRLLFGGDCTPEKLASLLATNRERGAILDSEGSFFDHLTGLYSPSANLDLFLKAYDGDPVEVGRVKREGSTLERPLLTLSIAVQPTSLEDLFGQRRLKGRGALARFMYALPANLLGKRRVGTAPLSDSSRLAYTQAILWLLNQQGRMLVLDETARRTLESFQAELEPRLGIDGDLEQLTDWAGKLAGLCVRLTGIFHLVDCAGSYIAEKVPSGVLMRVLHLARNYLIPHAQAAYEAMGATVEHADALFILRKLGEERVDVFKARDVINWARRRWSTMEPVHEALQLLVDLGWLQQVDPEAKPGRPTVQYVAHPQLKKLNEEMHRVG